MQRRRVMLAAGKKPRLPRGYQEVEYLGFRGAQFINPAYKPIPSTRITFAFATYSFTDAYLFGVSSGSNFCLANTTRYYERNVVNANFADRGDQNIRINISAATWYTFDLTKSKFIFDGTVYANSGGNPNINLNLYIGARNRNDTAEGFGNFDCKPFLIADTNGEARILVPCYRESDNKPGMYDLCGSICPLTNSPFYINAGTGEFLVGPDVN